MVDAARSACEAIYAEFEDFVHINDELLAANALSISPASVLFDVRRVALPLRFENARQEVNFHALSATLLGRECLGLRWAGLDKCLKDASGHDLTDTLLFGLIGMHLGGVPLHAEKLTELADFELSQFLNVSLTKSVPISEEQPGMAAGIYVERPSKYAPLVKDAREALAHTGRATDAQGYRDLGELIAAAAREAHDLTTPDGGSVEDALIEILGRRLPALRDRELDVNKAKQNALGASPETGSAAEDAAGGKRSAIMQTSSLAQLIWELRLRLRAGRENSGGEVTEPLYFCMEGLSDEGMLRMPAAPTISCIRLLLSSGILEVDEEALGRLRSAAQHKSQAPAADANEPGHVEVAVSSNGQDASAGGASTSKGAKKSDLEVLQSCDAAIFAAAAVACRRLAEALNKKAEEESVSARVSALDVGKWIDFLAKKASSEQPAEEPVQGAERSWNPDSFKAFPGRVPLFLTRPTDELPSTAA